MPYDLSDASVLLADDVLADPRPLDPVRFISNHSSGKQGYAIADALARLGADVRLRDEDPVLLDDDVAGRSHGHPADVPAAIAPLAPGSPPV